MSVGHGGGAGGLVRTRLRERLRMIGQAAILPGSQMSDLDIQKMIAEFLADEIDLLRFELTENGAARTESGTTPTCGNTGNGKKENSDGI